MKKIAIVTGGSGGIGRCTAAALHRAGCTVYEFSRREKPAEGIVHLTADITDEIVAATPIRARFVSSAVLSYFDEFTPKRRFRKKSFVMKEVVDTVDNLSRLFTPVLSFDLTD